MRKLVGTAVASLATAVAIIVLMAAAKDFPVVQYASNGELKFPTNYREWIYLTTGIGMSYGPAVQTSGRPPLFTNVFVEPAAYRSFMQSGTWPDKTMFVLEIYSSATHGSINKNGHYQDELISYDVAVKDESHNPKWAYYNFSPRVQTAKAFDDRCNQCHSKNGAVDNTFVQFYPSLLPVAWEKGTVREGIQPTAAILEQEIEKNGWAASKPLLDNVAKAEPDSDLLKESTLNTVGYQLLQAKRSADALSVFEEVVARYPQSANAYDSLADGYMAAGEKAKAKDASKKALELVASDTSITAVQKKAFQDAVNKRLNDLNNMY
ncbi:MAG TPA: cytochrome P460 family protein [Terriglobales bacterium]|nr:cytochrome P460 family protein [Terriglobales bacterium]